jgi:hypothetical protein
MLIRLSTSGSDGCADYSDDLAHLGEQVFQEKSLYSCSFYPAWPDSVLDRYRCGHAGIELQVRCRTLTGDPCDFSAVYKVHIGAVEADVLGSDPAPTGRDLEVGGALQHNFDQAVLVGIIEVAQDGKERRHEGMLSVVRLNTLDSLPNRQAKVSDVPMLRLKVVRGVIDNESGSPNVGRWVRLEFVNRNSVDQMIERGTQVVDGITENQRPTLERRWLQDREDEAVTCEVAVDLLRECVRVFLYPSMQLAIEQTCMFMRPLHLSEDAIHAQHARHSIADLG